MNHSSDLGGCLLILLLVALSGVMPFVALILFAVCVSSGLIDWP